MVMAFTYYCKWVVKRRTTNDSPSFASFSEDANGKNNVLARVRLIHIFEGIEHEKLVVGYLMSIRKKQTNKQTNEDVPRYTINKLNRRANEAKYIFLCTSKSH